MITDIETFDYEYLILDLSAQAKKLVPDDISKNDKKYVLGVIYNFMNVALDGLKSDDDLNYSNNEAALLLQFIGEWIFHKGIDLSRASIKKEQKDEILQKIAFVIYEIVKLSIERKLTTEQIIQVLEHHVNKTYKEELENLYNNKKINNEIYENALAQSNIDIFSDTKNSKDEINNENFCKKENAVLKFIHLMNSNLENTDNTFLKIVKNLYIGILMFPAICLFIFMLQLIIEKNIKILISLCFVFFIVSIGVLLISLIIIAINEIEKIINNFKNRKKRRNQQKNNEETINQLTEEINKLKTEYEELKQKIIKND